MVMAQYAPTGPMPGATPAPTAAPTLPPGIGNDQQVNQANQFIRAQPWYQDFLKQNGQSPNNVHLTKDQAYALLQLARKQGVGISTAYSIDPSGNITKEGMPGWEKIAIGAGIAVAGYFLAPAVIAALGGAGPATATATAAAAGDTAAASTLTAAGATLGGVEAGATAGLGAVALPGAGTALGAAGAAAGAAVPALASAATVPTAAGTVAGGAGATAAGAAALPTAAATATGSGLTGDLLRYGVPTAGSIIGGIIQANAAGNASDAQQKYLQEALDYEKNKDAAAIALESQRYSNYSGNIAPYVANGTAAGGRMASLFGLPASVGAPSAGASSGGQSRGVPVSADISAADLANYKALGLTPSGRGSGPTDSAYYDEEIAATGGLTDANKAYWFGPTGRIATDAQKAGITGAPQAQAPQAQAPQVQTAQPQARATQSGTVQMKAPDGSIKIVNAGDVAHYQQLGATVMGAA